MALARARRRALVVLLGVVVATAPHVVTASPGGLCAAARRNGGPRLEVVREAAPSLAVPLARCTAVAPTSAGAQLVCGGCDPGVVLGGQGHTGDPFAGAAFPCMPGGGEIFGCELPAPMAVTLPTT